VTRRALVQLGGLAAIPVIASIVVPPASAQNSNLPPTTTSTSGPGPTDSGGAG
jgi:hypothetical protein